MPSGKFPHLKRVTIDFWRSPCSDNGECFEFEIVEYILRSVVVLEKLVLYSSRSGCRVTNRCQDKCSFQYVHRLSAKLLNTFLVGTKAGEWELNKSKNKFEFSFSNYMSLLPKE